MAYESRFSGGFSSRFGNIDLTYHAPKPVKAKKEDGGVFGFLKNLTTDVSDLVVGLPMGVKTILSQNPTKTAKAIGLAVWQDWAPLIKGHPDVWWDQFKAHPLAPILDIAGLVTLGAGTAVRGGAAVGRLGGAIGKGGVVLKPESALVGVLRKTGGSKMMTVPMPAGVAGPAKRVEIVGKGSSKTYLARGLPETYKHYRANPVVRLRQHGWERASQAIGGSKAAKTTAPGVYRMLEKVDSSGDYAKLTTKDGIRGKFGDAHKFNKRMDKERSTRAHGFRAAMFSSMEAARTLFDDKTPMAQKVNNARAIEQNALEQFHYHAMTLGRRSGNKDASGKGYAMVADPKYNKQIALPKTWDAAGLQDFHRRMATEGQWMTDDIGKAMKDKDGKIMVVRKDVMSDYTKELGKSTDFLHMMWTKPTMIWKAAVLAYSPRFFVNNVVGNSLMYFMATNPAAALHGLVDAYKENRHTRALTDLERLQAGPFKKNLAYESQGMGMAEVIDDQGNNVSWSKGARRKQRAKSGLYGVTHHLSEDLFRQATMHWAARRTPEYWALRSVGHTHEGSVQMSMKLPVVRDALRGELDDVLGNYSHLTKNERLIKNVVPFYTWDRAILRHTRSMVLNRPYVAAAMVRLGEYGRDEFTKIFGDKLPHFLFNSVPVGDSNLLEHIPGFEKIPGRQSVISTAGMNPYSTVGELVQTGGSLVGLSDRRTGETVGSQLNPLLVGAIESISGTKLISGAPAKKGPGGLLGNVYGGVAQSVPQARLIQTMISGRPTSQAKDPDDRKPLLFRGDVEQQLLSLLGTPVKRFNKQTAEEIYWRQQGGNPSTGRWKPSSDDGFPANFGKVKQPGF